MPEEVSAQLAFALIQPETFHCETKPETDLFGIGTSSSLPHSPFRRIVLPAVHRAQDVDGVRRAVWELRLKPLAKKLLDLQWQPQQYVACLAAPAVRAASMMRSISLSLMAGMMGATITATGTPAALEALMASRRRGALLLGSILRAITRSSVVTEIATLASPRLAIRVRISMSRITSADFVESPCRPDGSMRRSSHKFRY